MFQYMYFYMQLRALPTHPLVRTKTYENTHALYIYIQYFQNIFICNCGRSPPKNVGPSVRGAGGPSTGGPLRKGPAHGAGHGPAGIGNQCNTEAK